MQPSLRHLYIAFMRKTSDNESKNIAKCIVYTIVYKNHQICIPVIMNMVVDFPAPLCPSNAVIWFSSISRHIPFTAVTFWPWHLNSWNDHSPWALISHALLVWTTFLLYACNHLSQFPDLDASLEASRVCFVYVGVQIFVFHTLSVFSAYLRGFLTTPVALLKISRISL